jgi:flavin-dependent dehydrogenase
MRRAPALIVGGGPAGAAAAIALARTGTRPLLLERRREPGPVVCGAFLGWDALAALRALGVDAETLGAHPIERVRLIAGRRRIERRLPHRAAGLSRQVLDEALLHQATRCGAGVEAGVAVRAMEPGQVRLADGATLAAETLFLATGKHPLRGAARLGAEGRHVGLRATGRGHPDLAGVIELHLFKGGYAGLLLQEDGCSNICLSVVGSRLAAAGSPQVLIAKLAEEAPLLGERLADVTGPWSAVAGVPYGWRATVTEPGLFRLGDQAGVIASLAGDGIAIALASGRTAAATYARDGAPGAEAFQRSFAARARRPIAVAEALRRAAERPRAAAAFAGGPARLPGVLRLAASLTRIGA